MIETRMDLLDTWKKGCVQFYPSLSGFLDRDCPRTYIPYITITWTWHGMVMQRGEAVFRILLGII